MENDSNVQRFSIDLIEGIAVPAITFYERDEPLCIYVIKTGWSKPQLYHVLIEFGDMMETTYHTLEASQILEKFGVNIENSYKNTPLVIRKETLNKIPNDSELGKHIRSLTII